MRRFLAATEGVSAIEFALVFNIMIVLYLGATDLAQMYLLRERLDLLAQAMLSMIAETPSKAVTSTSLTAAFGYAKPVMAESFSAATTAIRVSDVMPVYSKLNGWSMRVCWSRSSAPSSYPAYAIGSALPSGVLATSWYPAAPATTSPLALVLIESTTTYSPLTRFLLPPRLFTHALAAPPGALDTKTLNIKLTDLRGTQIAVQGAIKDASGKAACSL